ncbi:class I SAM-dependent methyltransferase [Paenibacillus lautus]|uniref:class I SAM-dependent methyltransferase n=1 Tax=Paenibacillus lautus TaxID=1401 RepID=UPI001C105C44|nr:class I SAM-dependent methyltransferase [Paenibacillus lautus]MBU5344249.1 class I SAM-dependent methyltransferase [Paenibacillus lautus]
MGIDWYDMIARRNGGYKGRAVCTVVGRSAEEVFEERLVEMLPQFQSVLDAGCGHGEFTLRMSRHAKNIIGFDNSAEMIRISQSLLESSGIGNVEFVFATTKTELPFQDAQFDLIYDRRGPTSIIEHPRILASGGTIIGIHNDVTAVRRRLSENGYMNVEIEEYNEAITYFPNAREFALFLSDVPGNPDFTLPEMKGELEAKIRENQINGQLGVHEHKYIWKAMKK